MGANSGRKLLVKKDDTLLAGVRTKGVAINREPIDITNDDDDGWRALLAEPGEKQVDINVGGVTKDEVLRAAAVNGEVLEDLTIEYPDGSKLEGDFFLNSFNETGEYNDAITFEATFQSSGPIDYTPAST
jgi:TP901-1 family phage major tail protein